MIYITLAIATVVLILTIRANRRMDHRIAKLKRQIAELEANPVDVLEATVKGQGLEVDESFDAARRYMNGVVPTPDDTAKILKKVMTLTPKWQQNRQGKSWLNKQLEMYRSEHPEIKAAWDRADGRDAHASCIAGEEGGVMIIDDPWAKPVIKPPVSLGATAAWNREQYLYDLTHMPHAAFKEQYLTKPTVDNQWSPESRKAIQQRFKDIFEKRISSKPEVWGLNGELDYSYLTPTHIKGVHPYCFRAGEWAEIIRLDVRGLRPCFAFRFPDGRVDTMPLCDLKNYETRS